MQVGDRAGGAETAVVVADSARGFRGGRRAPAQKRDPCRWAGPGQRGNFEVTCGASHGGMARRAISTRISPATRSQGCNGLTARRGD